MKKKIVIAGGTGFIGKYLSNYFTQQKYEVIIISRQPDTVSWQDEQGIVAALEDAEMLINLAGKSVDCRYNEKNKKEILVSRIETTKALGEALKLCQNPPELWLNSSTATIYRHAEDRPMTEREGEIGTGFSVGIATQWEKALFDFHLPKTRLVALRIAIVLGKDGGVMVPLKRLVQFGLGGHQGNGKQMFSWIHQEDLKNIMLFIQKNKLMSGVYNCSAPHPVPNNIFMAALRKAMGMPFGFPSPKWLLEAGALLIRTETELILKSRWVIPEKLIESGYTFQYDTIDKAFNEIINY
ncbi:MAG: TIGR01777 family protein [Cytophagaceae bacterium]|nr:TIGR01777 family protein [Cytophagaceae bacterium]